MPEFQNFNGHGGVEKGWTTFLNLSGQTITKGNGGHLATTANSNTGYVIVNNTAEEIRLFQGIAEADIINNRTGRFISFGYAESVNVYGLGTSITINPGDPLGPGAAASLGVNSAGLVTAYGPVICMESAAVTVSAGSYVAGWVRAL